MASFIYGIQNTIQDTISSAAGIPTIRHIILAVIVLICIILIWVGASMVLTQMFAQNGSQRIAYSRGGIVLLIGLLGITGVHWYRFGF